MSSISLELPPEVVEHFIDYLDDDRESLLACSQVARAWHVRSMAHLFRVVEIVHGDPHSWTRWLSREIVASNMEEAFIRVTVPQFLDQLLVEYPHFVRFVQHLQVSSGFGDTDGGDRDMPRTYEDAAQFFNDPRFHLPDQHRVTRLTISGAGFALPAVDPGDNSASHILHNFGRVTHLKMLSSHPFTLLEFSRALSPFRALKCLALKDWLVLEGDMVGLQPPSFAEPCTLQIHVGRSGSLGIMSILQWVALRPQNIQQVRVTVILPHHHPQSTDRLLRLATESPLEARRLVHVLELEMYWGKVPGAL